MELKTRKEIVFFVKYEELDAFINHHYPNLQSKFEFIADEEMNNDSCKDIYVDGQVDAYEKKKLLAGDTMGMTRAFLDDACRKELIKPGIYIIEVSW